MGQDIYLKVANKNNKDYKDIINEFKDKTTNIDRTSERGIISDDNQSSVLVKDNGNIQLASSKTTNQKLTQDKIIQTAQEIHTIANRQHLNIDELIINNQKLNPQLLELSDTKILFDSSVDAIGNLTMDGTVLVKAWDLNLKKYVLIRRKIRTPLFSHKLNLPEVPELIDTTSSYITDLTVDAAKLLMQQKKLKEKVTAEEQAAKGGVSYDQGEYNNYLTEFLVNSSSINGSKGYQGTIINSNDETEHTTNNDVISFNGTSVDYVWPVPQSHDITSGYGYRTLNGKQQWHNGIDIGSNGLGKKAKICASAAGTVEAIRTLTGESLPPYRGYGKCVVIAHEDGLKTLYAHLDKVLVKKGDKIVQGQWIGNMGETGEAFGVHLHFSIWGNGTDIKPGLNPNSYVKPQN